MLPRVAVCAVTVEAGKDRVADLPANTDSRQKRNASDTRAVLDSSAVLREKKQRHVSGKARRISPSSVSRRLQHGVLSAMVGSEH